jgi:ubiquinone/menaquinone biosynthesis C-methylase UbiE
VKRSPLTHGRVFDDKPFAQQYAERHRKMVERFGREYAEKLISRGFYEGRIIDVGCGFGAMNIVLARQFVDSEIVGIDLSDPLLRLANQSAQAAVPTDLSPGTQPCSAHGVRSALAERLPDLQSSTYAPAL